MIRRFIPFFAVGAWMMVWAVVINLSLTGLSKIHAMDWLPDRSSGMGFVLESRQRVQAAERGYRTGACSSTVPLVAVVGISDVREGIRLPVLAREFGGKARFIGVAGAGAGLGSVEEQADLILNSKIPVNTVVLGMSPLLLIDPDRLTNGASSVAERQSPLDTVKNEVRDAAWVTMHRPDLSSWLDSGLGDARSSMLKAIHADAPEDSRSPWRPMLRTLGMEHYPDAELRKSLAVLKATHADQPQTLATSKAGIAAGNLIRRFQAKGIRVIVVEMPQHPWLRALLPPGANAILADRLRQQSGDASLAVLDFGSSIGADGFIDLVHLNTAGGETFSAILGQALIDRHTIVPAQPAIAASTERR